MYTIHKSIDVSFAHHVRGHRGHCINIHGHTWKFEVGLSAATLDPEGFVIDFGRLRGEVLEPCHRLLDHSLAVGSDTYADIKADLAKVGEKLVASRDAVHSDYGASDHADSDEAETLELHGAFLRRTGGIKVTVFPFNPTSERLSEWLYGLAESTLADERVSIAYARVFETLHPVESVATFRK